MLSNMQDPVSHGSSNQIFENHMQQLKLCIISGSIISNFKNHLSGLPAYILRHV
ncbi:hypothetical protein DCAR_0730135 [Daucus carota subsp. sativus]|uniref:Uncharacterized protein n=1 Tax=Daucus carota subsp. sativus TaxID=79200 RepID=A0A161Y9K0_DAUCS|nr:hypothetical protein DCAR_0730135 [Daucus carota subsp. sativus]